MPTHIALLRGVNVGGRGKVPMADLRDIATTEGLTGVGTYVQSGNLLFTSDGSDSASLARRLEKAIANSLEVTTRVVILPRDELADAIASNPYPDETDPKHLHLGFGMPSTSDASKAVADAVAAATAKGGGDDASIVGGVLYLRTPNGLGRSDLANRLGRLGGSRGPGVGVTMRNWATVTKLLALCDVREH